MGEQVGLGSVWDDALGGFVILDALLDCSLLGLRGTAPYGHHGRAQNVGDVFQPIASGGLGHPTEIFSAYASRLNATP